VIIRTVKRKIPSHAAAPGRREAASSRAPSCFQHVDDHRGHERGGDKCEHALAEGQHRDLREPHAEDERGERRGARAPPHCRQQHRPARLTQVRGGDGDDEKHLDPLAQRDDEHLPHVLATR